MKIYRSGDSNQPNTRLRQLAPKPAQQPRPSAIAQSQPAQASERPERASETPNTRPFVYVQPFWDSWTLPFSVGRFSELARERITLPAWAIASVVLLVVVVPVIVLLMTRTESVDEGVSVPVTSNEQNEPTVSASNLLELPELQSVETIGTVQRTFRRPAVSSRETYLITQGVNPARLEILYAADEVERLQAELEAIQRNSALLRSLTRQQSGDLSMAYSSLEATQEQKDGALEDLQSRISELEGRIQTVDDLARDLRSVLGLPQPQGGTGGPSGSTFNGQVVSDDPWLQLRSDIVAIEQQAGTLVYDLDAINTEVQLRVLRVQQAGLPRGNSIYDDLNFYEAMPVGWPVEGPITSRFGLRGNPFDGQVTTEMHTGIDIAAPTGTPVRATGAGTVRIAGDYGGYGLLVVIDHGRGVSTWYGHNSRLQVVPGQSVGAGQTIADVGSTGRSTGPHVHYEVRINNAVTDPIHLMQMSR